jgi:toxin YoeB
VSWAIVFARPAQRDAGRIAAAGLKEKGVQLLAIIEINPFQNPPPYEKLVGDLSGAYSRRIKIQHRPAYQALESQRTIKFLRIWTHYE